MLMAISTPALVLMRLINALRVIGTWGASRSIALLGPVRRVLSIGFFKDFIPRCWNIVKSHGPNAATIATLYYTFRGELLSADDAFKIAKEKGIDELMKGHDPAGVIMKLVDSMPDVPPEHKETLKRALVEGLHDSPKANSQPKPPTQTTIIPTQSGPVVAGNSVDQAIAQRVNQIQTQQPGATNSWRVGTSVVSVNAPGAPTQRAQYMVEVREFNSACRRFAIKHNISDPRGLLYDIQDMYVKYGDLINVKEQ
jgi:hypothetical protein